MKVTINLDKWLESKAETYRFESRQCVFCGVVRKSNTTGMLPVIGRAWKCTECKGDYDKVREEKRYSWEPEKVTPE